MDKVNKDKQLRQYELLEYFGDIAREANAETAGDILLHNIAESCPPHFMEDMDAYICGKLVGLLEVCLDALQSVPKDAYTPFQVKAALSHLGQQLVDINDPRLKELREMINGK